MQHHDGGEPHLDDPDAAHGDSRTFASVERSRTVATSVHMYRYENGRRYHAYRDGEYYQPNDDKQAASGNIEHHLWLLTLRDALFLAPLPNPQRVLDVGTGTGLWPIDVGDRYPAVEVIGTDLSPIQGTFAPPNVRFEIDDCCSEWTFPENSFDLIHVRALLGCVGDWPKFYSECLKHLQPDGYLEQLEYSVHIRSTAADAADDAFLATLGPLFVSAGEKMGKTFEIAETMRGLIEDAGFVDIREQKFIWPIGPWSADERLREIGRWNLRNWEDGLEGWVMALLTRMHGWSYEKVQNYRTRLLRVLRKGDVRAYHEVLVVHGRKSG